jgi:hypothetical protein
LKTAKKYDVAWHHGFCAYLEKDPKQISNILEEAENIFILNI